MYAPRAKFELLYIVSPIKVAIIFLTSLHCIFLLVAFLTSFWIETRYGHYGPLFTCEKRLNRKLAPLPPITVECHLRGFPTDVRLIWIPFTALLLILAFALAFASIVVASLSFNKHACSIRRRYWLTTILLLGSACTLDCLVLIVIPFIYRYQNFHLLWAYGVHCGATVFIGVSAIVAILTHNTDDIHYIEGIDTSCAEK